MYLGYMTFNTSMAKELGAQPNRRNNVITTLSGPKYKKTFESVVCIDLD